MRLSFICPLARSLLMERRSVAVARSSTATTKHGTANLAVVMPTYSFGHLLLVAALLSAVFGSGLCSRQPEDQQQHLPQQQQHATADAVATGDHLQPPVWPEQFRSLMVQNRTNRLALVTLYYDWHLGANLNIISSQLNAQGVVWDLEWNNGTSFIFSREKPVCKVLKFEVGILTPDWLKDSKYLGQTATDNFVTDVWTKAKFINYYAEKDTGRPVRWTFLWSNAEFHTMEWEEGATLSSELWQAPEYCFNQPSAEPSADASILDNPIATGRMMRLDAAQEVKQQVQALHLQTVEHNIEQLLPTS